MIASALPQLDANRSFRVLLVEDDAENAGLARQRLSEIAEYSFEVLQVTRLSEANRGAGEDDRRCHPPGARSARFERDRHPPALARSPAERRRDRACRRRC